MDPRFLPFKEAREYARSLKLKSSREWFTLCKSKDFPHNIPKTPGSTYVNDGWDGFSDWLGTGKAKYLMKKQGRLSFEEAREFVRSLHLSGIKDWWAYCKSGKKPANIPSAAHEAYRDEWQGYGDFIGTGKKRHTKFLPFEEAREFARSLNFYTSASWEKFAKSDERAKNIPYAPYQTYKKEWRGWKDWLRKTDEIISEHLVPIDDTEVSKAIDAEIDEIGSEYLPYEQAREFVQKLGLKGLKKWFAYAKSNDRPKNIPSTPNQIYHKSWTGYPDWLGTTRTRHTKFLPFEEAREFARKISPPINGSLEWEFYCRSGKRPNNIPSHPEVYYAQTKEWTNWYDWLGKTRTKSVESATTRRIISRFQELEKLELSVEDIMNKLLNEFPTKSQNDIKQIILKWAKTQSD